MGKLHYGTSSWSEKSWVGPFYPEGTEPGEFLTHYATQFRTVEADVTYYRIPSPQMVDGWVAKTPEEFRIAAKFPRSIVHCGDRSKPNGERVLVAEHVAADTDAFLEVMLRLGDRCGPLVLQFPYFNKGAFASAGPFLARLDAFLGDLPKDFRYAVEVRNKAWVSKALLEILRRHRVALVLVDLLYMPHPAELATRFKLVTTDFVYARLVGDRNAVEERTERFDRLVIDQGERLSRWSTLLRSMLDSGSDAWVYANNHYAGHGPATIRELAQRIAAEGVGR